jgi:hypothetical protein
MTGLSCHRFQANEMRLLLRVLAHNLRSLPRRRAPPVTIQGWSLTSLRQRRPELTSVWQPSR